MRWPGIKDLRSRATSCNFRHRSLGLWIGAPDDHVHPLYAHRLFNEPVRAFSHGCIRVSDPLALATLVL
jgi:hypothetical protein